MPLLVVGGLGGSLGVSEEEGSRLLVPKGYSLGSSQMCWHSRTLAPAVMLVLQGGGIGLRAILL